MAPWATFSCRQAPGPNSLEPEKADSFQLQLTMSQRPQTVNRKLRKGGGFTLIEMMVTLGILAILLGLVTLNAPSFLATFRLSSGARQVATDLQLVRMKAIAQNRKFRALFTAGSTTYEVQRRNDADTGWDFHALYGHGTTAGAAQPISLPQGVQINSAPADGDVIFQPRGTGENATIVVKHSVLSTTKSVVVNMAGRVRIQ